MKASKWIFIFCFIFIRSLPVFAENSQHELLDKLNKEKIFFSVQWNVGLNDSLKVIVREKFNKKIEIPIRELIVYQNINNHFEKVYSFETPDYPVSISQTQDSGGKLLTVWTAGSSYHISAYSFSSGNIVRVLETGSKMMPEIIHLDSGTDAFIITVGNEIKSDESEIYCWHNNSYVMRKKSSFEKRFERACKGE